MGISIYYVARRETPVSAEDRTAINEILRTHAGAPDWEDFCVFDHYQDCEPGVVFEGATGLPMTNEDEFWAAIQHWCRVLSMIRRVLPDGVWSVHIDDHEIRWDDERNEYDLSS